VVKLAVSQQALCDYCLAAHTLMGGKAGLSADAIQPCATTGRAATRASMRWPALCTAVARTSGDVPAEVVLAVKQAGYSDAQIVDTLLAIAAITFTNLFNRVNVTAIGLPARGLIILRCAGGSAAPPVWLSGTSCRRSSCTLQHQVFQHQLGCHGQQGQVLVFSLKLVHGVGHLAQMVGDQAAQLGSSNGRSAKSMGSSFSTSCISSSSSCGRNRHARSGGDGDFILAAIGIESVRWRI
jgi:AhpD family alkylhydroperoxidase